MLCRLHQSKFGFSRIIQRIPILFLAVAFVASGHTAKAEDSKPNILFIMTDQQHAGMMSCAGNKWLNTPALDKIAKEGIRFERAYCANPVCVPSRISMATGVMPCRLGADDNKSGMKIQQLPLEVDANSMGKLMKRAGYDTFYGGKVHMCKSLVPRNAGYDVYFKDERDRLPAACLKFITQKRSKPFFAVASFINPHDICFAHLARNGKNTHNVLDLHKQASSLALEDLPPLPENYAVQQNEPVAIESHLSPKAITPAITMRREYDERAWRINRWIYHRLTEKVDAQIGIILDGLKEAGLEENTLIIFTSDHGNMDASHRLASKGLFYEESVGVPLILKYKGRIPAGRNDDIHLISTGLDILPTLCDYAGVKQPAHLIGKSLRPLAETGEIDQWRGYVASENHYTRMIRSGKYKYVPLKMQTEKSYSSIWKTILAKCETLSIVPIIGMICSENQRVVLQVDSGTYTMVVSHSAANDRPEHWLGQHGKDDCVVLGAKYDCTTGQGKDKFGSGKFRSGFLSIG